ncbi:hypothetical protein OG819_51565 [Streptomyces sp. NBC_01549]|uniref:hypothetical protein n=1 Tax=unclassified Streptomyces TaxID=2593676 RepID=UPI00224FD9EC|nr:hypothetical protein [Streptomyces sp. NBC_01549]MCX4597695.1 hypothetical protein [Streptomyces sp. NBC_01549]
MSALSSNAAQLDKELERARVAYDGPIFFCNTVEHYSTIIGDARMHRLIRRGTTYGPPLPEPRSWAGSAGGAGPAPRGAYWKTTVPTAPRLIHILVEHVW